MNDSTLYYIRDYRLSGDVVNLFKGVTCSDLFQLVPYD